MPAAWRGNNRCSAAVTKMVTSRNKALAGIASRKNSPKAKIGCKSESKISQVLASTQSISMNAGKVGRKKRTDTPMAVAPKTSACAHRQPNQSCGRGGSFSCG